MERRKELIRLMTAFIVALTLGFWLSDKIDSALHTHILDTGVSTDTSPMSTLPFDQQIPAPSNDDGAEIKTKNKSNTNETNTQETSTGDSTDEESPQNTRPLRKYQPKTLVSEVKVAQNDPKISGAPSLSAEDKALLFEKSEFTDENAKKKEEDSGEDFFETEFDLDHLVKKSEQTDGEKAFAENMNKIIEAQGKLNPAQDSLSDLNRYKLENKDTRRFGIQLHLPESNDPMKLKLHYREAPEFGASSANVPELILPEVKKDEPSFIEVERTRTSESPWNNFDSSSNRSGI